jgi:GT2 family glycosyltransferase
MEVTDMYAIATETDVGPALAGGSPFDGGQESAQRVSVIAAHYRQPDVLARMAATIDAQGIDLELVVANASPEVALSGLPENCRVFNVENRGYAAAVNRALEYASGDVLVVCNSDVFLADGCITKAVEYLRSHKDVGVVAPQLANADGSPQHNARRFYTWLSALWARFPMRSLLPRPRFFTRYLMADERCGEARDVDWLMGALLVVRRSALRRPDRVFDPRYRFYMEDVDFCLDMWRRGWRVVQLPQTGAVHLHARGSRRVLSRPGYHHAMSFLKFLLKHHGLPQRTA